MICKFKELAVDISQRDAEPQNLPACHRERPDWKQDFTEEWPREGAGNAGARELVLAERLLWVSVGSRSAACFFFHDRPWEI